MHLDYNGPYLASEETYMAATVSTITIPVGTKAFFVLMGSATKKIRVTRIHMSGLTLTASAYNMISMRKISSIPSGGTTTALTKTSLDSALSNSTASLCQMYTVEPTTDGTLVGTIQSQKILMQDTVAKAGDPNTEIYFNLKPLESSSGVILRGINEGITAALATSPATAVTLSLEVEWSEID